MPNSTGNDEEPLFSDLAEHGRFDIVVCDAVLNSVDSIQAEQDIMVCLNALCRPGGRVYCSGRRLEDVWRFKNQTQSRSRVRRVEFLDEHGFSAIYRRGVWTYQKFHSRPQAKALGREFVGRLLVSEETRSSWQMAFRKTVDLDKGLCLAALGREFDLPWPDNRRMGLSEPARRAFLAALARENEPCGDASPSPNTCNC